MWLQWWVLMRLYYYHHLPVNIWYVDAELGISLLDRCELVILLTSCQCRADGMGWGGGWGGMQWEAWEVPLTLFPSPSAAPTTCHTHHGPDPSSTLTGAHLPSSPPEQQGASRCQLCRNSLHNWLAEAWTNSRLANGRDFSFVRAVTFYKQWHK